MTHARRYAVGLVVAGLALATGTPAYLAHAAPHLSVYLLNPVVLLLQAVPYVVCAAIWLPWRSTTAAASAVILAALLFIAAVALYVPMLLSPGHGGDMIGFAFIVIAFVTTAAVLIASAAAGLVIWVRHRAEHPQ